MIDFEFHLGCILTIPAAGSGCTDILAHLMEGYFPMTDHVDLSDCKLEADSLNRNKYARH